MTDLQSKQGERLKAIRVNQSFTQEDFSALLSIGREKLSRIESGKTALDPGTLKLIGLNYGPEKLYWLITGFELPTTKPSGPYITVNQVQCIDNLIPAFVGQDGTYWAIMIDSFDNYMSRAVDTEYLLGLDMIGFSNAFSGRAYRAFLMDQYASEYFITGDRALCGSVLNMDQLHPAGIYIVITRRNDIYIGKVKPYTDGAIMVYQEASGRSADIMTEDIYELWEVMHVITTPGVNFAGESKTIDSILKRLADLEASIKR